MRSSENMLCMFTAAVSEKNGSYVLEVPKSEVEFGTLETNTPFSIGVFDQSEDSEFTGTGKGVKNRPTPPVEQGDTRTVEIESIGDQGDGIAKVDSGFVLIVPNTEMGDEVEVKITQVNESFAIAEPVSDEVDAPTA